MADDPRRVPDDLLERGLEVAFGGGSATAPMGRSVLDVVEWLGGATARVILEGDDAPTTATSWTPDSLSLVGGFGKHQVLGEVARGGMGVILKSHDVDLGRDVAMKVLRERHADNPSVVQRFVEEAQIGGQLQHPGIVPVYEMGLMADDRPYFTMKLVKGRTLGATLAERDDPAQDRRRFLSVFEQVCQTVAYAHSRGVIHRDLKPSNVMVGSFGEIQVVDWGLAKVLRGEVKTKGRPNVDESSIVETVRTGSGSTGSHSLAGSVMGTPAYMAPEQAQGEVDRLDERADVFGLGAILCEILTGKPPYLGKSAGIGVEAARAAQEDAYGRLDASGAERALIDLAKRCMTPAKEARPANAGVVATAVGEYLTSVEERARRAQVQAAEARVKAEEERKARRLTMALAASVLVTAAVVGGGWLWMDRQEQERRAQATRVVEAQLERAQRFRGDALAAPLGDLSGWELALGAVESASRLVSAELGPDLSARIEALGETLRSEREAAALAVETREREERMAARLADVLTPWDEDVSRFDFPLIYANQRETGYIAAFTDFDFDVEAMSVEAAAARITGTSIREAFAAALDDWALARRTLGVERDGWERFVELAQRVDVDETRDLIRHRILGGATDETALLEGLRGEAGEGWSPATVRLVAGVFAAEGEHERAAAILERGVQGHPGDFVLNFTLGLMCEQMTSPDYERAVDSYRAAYSLRPRSLATLSRWAIAQAHLGEYAAAVASLERVVEARPDSPYAHHNLGFALSKIGDFERMEVESLQSWQLDQDFAPAYASLAVVHYEQGKLDDAENLCRRAIELDGGRGWAWANLGSVLRDRGDRDGAREAFEKAVQLDPHEAYALNNLGDYRAKSGDFDGAYDFFERALEVRPRFPEALNNLAHLLANGPDEDRRDLERALVLSKEAVRLADFEHEYWSTLGGVRYRLGLWRQAVEALDQARAIRNNLSDQSDFLLAMALARLGQLDRARWVFSLTEEWMHNAAPDDEEIGRFHREARDLLASLAG